MVLENEKNIVVKKETWLELGKLKEWPERRNFNDVIKWLNSERKIWREFYIRELMSHGFDRAWAEESCNHARKMLDESDEGWAVFDD